jgi:hypothetical protein
VFFIFSLITKQKLNVATSMFGQIFAFFCAIELFFDCYSLFVFAENAAKGIAGDTPTLLGMPNSPVLLRAIFTQ